MSESLALSRRRALKVLSGVPMLPLASSLAGLPFIATAAANGAPVRFEFGSMAAPSLANPAQMATTYVASTLTQKAGHHKETFALGYETFFLTGEFVAAGGGGSILAGGYYDINNAPIIDATSPDLDPFFADCPDGMSLVRLDGARSRRHGCKRIFAVVQFEYTSRNAAGDSMYGRLPSPIAILSLDQDERTGKLPRAALELLLTGIDIVLGR